MPRANKGMRLYVILICGIHIYQIIHGKKTMYYRCPLKRFLRSSVIQFDSHPFSRKPYILPCEGEHLFELAGLYCNNIACCVIFKHFLHFFKGFSSALEIGTGFFKGFSSVLFSRVFQVPLIIQYFSGAQGPARSLNTVSD